MPVKEDLQQGFGGNRHETSRNPDRHFPGGFVGVAAAGEAHRVMQPGKTIELLSQATGMTIKEVEIALGPSANYEHPVGYASVIRRFRQAVGRTVYEQIIGDGELSARQVQDLVAMAEARQAKLAATSGPYPTADSRKKLDSHP